MAYNEQLAERMREALADVPGITEKKMFGGLAFMKNEKMFCGIIKEELMMRTLMEQYEEVLQKPHCREMDFTGRTMRGFVMVEVEGMKTPKQLKAWLDIAVEFAEKAPPAKKKTGKRK